MQRIDAILFDPVGSLAEFPPEPFVNIAAQVFAHALPPGRTGSQAYWEVLALLEAAGRPLRPEQLAVIEGFELAAVERADVYADAAPALPELNGLGVRLVLASSLSHAATTRFLERASLGDVFSDIWSRDRAGRVARALIARAIVARPASGRAMFLTDTVDGLRAAAAAGAGAILMMNDPDEAMRLTAQNPDAGIVSLHELPDFVRFVAAQAAHP